MSELFDMIKASFQVLFYKLDRIISLLEDLLELEKTNRYR